MSVYVDTSALYAAIDADDTNTMQPAARGLSSGGLHATGVQQLRPA